ncbi:MAG TPA: S41 family peptidase [Vicinamibacterales bacterium]|jgi:carboxyl-terminal processing protease|nr:S41 family peptidase [Vicinamibacterales bacterium]
MTSRARLIVLSVSAPVIVFVIVGGFLGRVMAREDSYQHLRIFDDVVNLITEKYVEPVNVDKVMHGGMRGLAEGLDPDSAYLSPQEAKQAESGGPLPAGDVGLDLTRQYYLRVIAARDGSPAAKAGLRTGDYVRAIDNAPTREMSVWEGLRALRGAPGTKVALTIIRGNQADPHVVDLRREALTPSDVTGRIAASGVAYVRIAAIGAKTADQVKKEVGDLTKSGAIKLIVDVRRTSGGALEDGLAVARLFVGQGVLAMRETRGIEKQTINAAVGDGTITVPAVLLIDTGTSGAAELFAAALSGNKRADLIGEHTIGRTGSQKLIKLPDGSGLWLTTTRYLTPAGTPLHAKGLEPTVAIDEPDVEFGQPGPTTDEALEKALERLTQKAAA